MKELKAQVVVPSFLGGSPTIIGGKRTFLSLRGILVLGDKKSDEDYYEQDLDMLATLAQEHAIAFENARLYDEAIQRSQELSAINKELEHAQNQLLAALDEAEKANRRLQATQAALIVAEKKATLVGMAQAIGHEIYNPLSPIGGWAQSIYNYDLKTCEAIFARHGPQMSEDDRCKIEKTLKGMDKKLRTIENSANRIEGVVRTLTGTLKESTGEMGPRSLAVFFRRVLETSRFTTGEENLAGCEIELDVLQNLVVFGNDSQLEQVFLNLIKNAYEAMLAQEHRHIKITACVDEANPIMAKIVFSDNGPGIGPEALPKIWTQGFSTKAKKDGSIGAAGQGQGLFVCKHIIETFHKGSITVESAAGQGTTFIIKLPLAITKDTDSL